MRDAWSVGKTTKVEYADVVQELNATKLVGEASVFERGPHFPVTHMAYFKPVTDAFLVELKNKDRRSGKEWEYINSSGVWIETGLIALDIARKREGTPQDLGRRMALAGNSFKAALEIFSMRAQYFHDITEHGIEGARQMAFIVEQGNDAINSASYKTAHLQNRGGGGQAIGQESP